MGLSTAPNALPHLQTAGGTKAQHHHTLLFLASLGPIAQVNLGPNLWLPLLWESDIAGIMGVFPAAFPSSSLTMPWWIK